MRDDLRYRMGNLHEIFLADLLGGAKSKGSGNRWYQPMDGRTSRRSQEFAFAFDGKATLASSISVSKVMWNKACEQSLGERPMLGLRFYSNESLEVALDLAVVNAYDLSELIEKANHVD